MEQITSRDNQYVRQIRRLLSETKYRRQTGLFALEGARLCGDAAVSKVEIQMVLVTPHAMTTYPEVMASLEAVCPRVVEISEDLAAYMGDTTSPQGVFCLCKGLDKNAGLGTIEKNGVYLALENLQDPANLGAIIRSAEALGLSGLILSAGCCDRYNPKVLRASMGGVFRLPLIEVESMPAAITSLQGEGMTGYACVVEETATPVQSITFAPGAVAVIGNEGNGLTPDTVAACAHAITIRMAGRAESLNASVAASLIAWEMTKGL